MSKRSWRLVICYFVVLILFAVLSLTAADFSDTKTIDRKAKPEAGKKSISLKSLGAGHSLEARLVRSVRTAPPRLKMADKGSYCRRST